MADSLLLDTTYLLPLFGLESRLPNFDDSFRQLLSDYEVKYNPVSLLEAKWLVLRLARRKKAQLETFLNYYREGIRVITKGEPIVQTAFTEEKVEGLSDKLLIEADLRDYFDRQIYSTAACQKYLLLTEDGSLHQLYQSHTFERPKAVIRWKNIILRK